MAVCQPILAPGYLFSNWVCADLPILFKVYSDKFPINTFDDQDSISSIADDGAGNSTITLSSTSETYVKREYIQITGASDDRYNGIWQVLAVSSSTVITIDAPFIATDTGTFQRYYRNYNINIKVYAGIPSGHTLEAKNPMTEVGEVKVRPGNDGTAIVDISDYIRQEIKPIENKLCEVLSEGNGFHGNDWNLWTAFYIAYAESYDQSDGFEVTTFTSDYTTDTTTGYDNYLQYAVNAALQFQDPQGRSIGGYAIADTEPDEVPAQFMTTFEKPRYFLTKEFDIAIINALSNDDLVDGGYGLEFVLVEKTSDGDTIVTETSPVIMQDEGLYRFAFSEYPLNVQTELIDFYLQRSTGEQLTETKTIIVDRTTCGRGDILLRWLNHLGAFDGYWFVRNHDNLLRVKERKITRRNIYKDFDDVFVSGDTQNDYYHTEAVEGRTVRSQFLTNDEANQLKWLLSSNKVYEVFDTEEEGCSRHKRRTVLIDSGSYIPNTLREKLKKISFSYEYTDNLILPGQ